uniref:Uncharacterized protein n=1 Tax=Entomoneis paludosa TaxID=265537 RepID=A0A7S3DSF8_9STRA|mmetsp:Transcript_32873/g.68517  ORF Transcript_32873/g.68517 Transcript_32873/m.68517 type:complete len:144 (+) Transcript_32873:2-433(+)
MIHICGQIPGNPLHLRMSLYLNDGVQEPNCDDSAVVDFCDDDFTKEFLVEDIMAYRDCSWLERNPDQKSKLCKNSHEAYHLCSETCGKCSDNCEDDEGKFYVNSFHRMQDCEWLSSKPYWQDRLCYSGHRAFELCHESCDRCD